jgi:hypothetical protein
MSGLSSQKKSKGNNKMTNEEEKIEIELPVAGIKITLNENDEGDYVGAIKSGLHEENETAEEKAAVDTLESFILACACAEIDIESPAFLCAIETTIEAIGNN